MSGILSGAASISGSSPAAAATVATVKALLDKSLPQPAPCLDLQRGLAAVAPQLTQAEQNAWIAVMTRPLLKAAITTPRRIAAFLGQCSAESGGFRNLEEDLSYSAIRLCQVWPVQFSTFDAADAYAFQPELLANRVYADRMGNGDIGSGDGWRFRGRGLIQLTGRINYERFAAAMNLDLDAAAQQASTLSGAAESAAWFWTVNSLNEFADRWSIILLTERISGGKTGATERSRLCNAALQAIGSRPVSPHVDTEQV